MAFSLANYMAYNGWGADRLCAGSLDPQLYFEGISLIRSGQDITVGQRNDLLILSPCFFAGAEWPAYLSSLKKSGAIAAAFFVGQTSPENSERLLPLCRQLSLPLLELPEQTQVHDLLLQDEHFFSIDNSGKALSMIEIYNLLRRTVYTSRINGLLQMLHTCMDCRTAILIKQDIYAYPPLGELDKIHIDTKYWRRLLGHGLFPQIESYYLAQNQSYHIRCEITYDGNPLGMLVLSRQERPFSKKELQVADYAAILCAGMNHTFIKSQNIHSLLESAYLNSAVRPEDALLLTEYGYAMVLRESPAPFPKSSEHMENDNFLGYLIHSTFGNGTFYAFLANGDLILYSDTADIRAYTRQLLSLLRKNRRAFLAGVSQRYPRERINSAFAEARHAANIGQYLDDTLDMFFFHDMGIYRFFNYPENGWTINQMLDEMTEKLDTLGPEKKLVLTKTLTCLVKNNFNYSKTSEELFTHPNTIRYRIRLLEEMWGKDLSRDEDRLLFSVIGKLLPLWQRYTGRI